ncbi:MULTISPECIES: BCCT family transporter [unclassified Pseudoalteromonas]|uniref:BCCT family transporter n=1 Tax=unclassified Pseudoalteromonas TaxID=194690 RepID=UPI0004677B20|nr:MULTISPECIES: BCCT family transporter [unclassified Pseudoalteromonas]
MNLLPLNKTLSTPTKLEKTALLFCVGLSVIAFLFPELLTEHLQPAINKILGYLGSPFFILVNLLLFSVIAIAISPLGQRKIGGAQALVEFSTFGWLSMLFAAGMGSGLIFWGVAEPALHTVNSPLKQSLYPNNQTSGLALTLVNWGAHAWALYAVFGLVLGGLTRNSGKAGDISAPVISATKGVINRAWQLQLSFSIKLIAILAIFFGVVGTIANSTLLLRKGLELELGVESALFSGFIIIFLIALLYTISAKLGLKKGIQTLSKFNVFLAFALIAWLLIFVPIKPIIDIAVGGTWDYIQLITTGTWQFESVLNDPAWATGWTYNYYFWWLAWGPFVGVFLAKISQGRPVWQYILGVVFVPTFVTIIWFSVFSGSAIAWDQTHNAGILEAIKADYTQGLFVFFEQLGWQGGLLIWSSLLLLLIFVATSADSAVLVIRQLSGASEAQTWSLYAWSFALGLCAFVLLVQNNEPLNRSVAIIGALPFLIIFILQLIGFIKEFIREFKH